MQASKHGYEFNVVKILACIRHIAMVSNVVTAIYHTTKNYSANCTAPLETNGLGFVFPSENGEAHVNADMIHDWVLTKAFEDFIVGLSQSLIEACRFLDIAALAERSKHSPFQGYEAMRNAMDGIMNSYNRAHVPEMLDLIEKGIKSPLPLKEEILSINKVRNCLVHRNGLVTTGDINDKDKKSLVLKYCDLAMFIQYNDQIIPLTREVKESRTYAHKLLAAHVHDEVAFRLNQKVQLTPDIFKSITYTSIVFIQNLIALLPVPDEIKASLIQPLTVALSATNAKSPNDNA